ncbi:MAG: XrtA/PEP-CTERM system histidine kinase PrsK [Thermodesulfobacteriota bacterium]|nr:XrtA/PEP-CTERM system histidine kinase PrsK [Thermodesulfobacteriota bacterium]
MKYLYILNFLLMLSGLYIFRLKRHDRRYSFNLVRGLLGLLLLAGVYIYSAYHLTPAPVSLLLFSESVFVFTFFYMANSLCLATMTNKLASRLINGLWIISGVMVVAGGVYLAGHPVFQESETRLTYFYTLFCLLTVLATAWRIESFWQLLQPIQRWEYKFLVIGGFLICGTLGWSFSYRLTYSAKYRGIVTDYLLLLAILTLLSLSLMIYAVTRHRLLNRKMFISRQVIYTFVAPSIFAIYLTSLGIISLIIKTFGYELHFVLFWFLAAAGLVGVTTLALSGKARQSVKYFISTNFYNNKYEYRDEWLAFSSLLRGELSEAEVVDALRRVLLDSMYTTRIMIWIGSMESGYRQIGGKESPPSNAADLTGDDLLIKYVREHDYLYIDKPDSDPEGKRLISQKQDFFKKLGIVLLVPLAIGDQCLGLIGIGPEYTDGRYGKDDFDLLSALGTQAASALLSIRMAEELARSREQEAFDTLSAFVLHDVKNAAAMLSLVKGNAPDHIHNPEFQRDMLETIDDALKRMAKVQDRLNTLKGKSAPIFEETDLNDFLKICCRKLEKKLPFLSMKLESSDEITISIDKDTLTRVLENILLNALEAGGRGTEVIIRTFSDEKCQAVIEIYDNGPGIPAELLPDHLFEPFKTGKPKGSGIGLWQVKQLVGSLNGEISAENVKGGGARFTVRLPIDPSHG